MAAGIALGIGMLFTLAFLAVGLVAAWLLRPPDGSWRGWAGRLAATGVGFVAVVAVFWIVTSANPLAIWWANQANHARFYVEYPRSYATWVLVNPIELVAAFGGAASVAVAAGIVLGGRKVGMSAVTLGVLAILTLSGRSLSEVARLWLPLMPAVLVAAGRWAEWGGWRPLAVALLLLGGQVLAFEAAIQTVYPVAI
jgi:hypothetical protein